MIGRETFNRKRNYTLVENISAVARDMIVKFVFFRFVLLNSYSVLMPTRVIVTMKIGDSRFS